MSRTAIIPRKVEPARVSFIFTREEVIAALSHHFQVPMPDAPAHVMLGSDNGSFPPRHVAIEAILHGEHTEYLKRVLQFKDGELP